MTEGHFPELLGSEPLEAWVASIVRANATESFQETFRDERVRAEARWAREAVEAVAEAEAVRAEALAAEAVEAVALAGPAWTCSECRGAGNFETLQQVSKIGRAHV